ncbi:hypothetical protein Vau01_014180 [Virgisporangium aurantiacum]|uniref:Helix-turn-helix domain-containing protein n=1 Tax=Virgisporangium aurantiacum TaxID=175570 RepID=A0A8J3Z098_9ACTN|nr:hypothetical protein Vau01_014180 [Virgisporangium aurantiacum]
MAPTSDDEGTGLEGTSRPPLYRPIEVARLLGCSEWWVKEQARKRRIPFSWIGGSYRFTDDHVNAIVEIFEKQPTFSATPVPRKPATQGRPAESADATQLKARAPRRLRSASNTAA